MDRISIDRDLAPAAFASELSRQYRTRMQSLVDRVYDDAFFDAVESPEALLRSEAMPAAWREYYLGCFAPAKQQQLIYELGEPFHRDRDLMVGLSKQIADELKHAKLWVQIAERFGVEETDLTTWTPEFYDRLVAQARGVVEYDRPQFIACAFQCSVEIMPALKNRKLVEFIEDTLPTAADVIARDIVSDEGDHVHVGRKIIGRFATREDYDELIEIANRQYEATYASKRAQLGQA